MGRYGRHWPCSLLLSPEGASGPSRGASKQDGSAAEVTTLGCPRGAQKDPLSALGPGREGSKRLRPEAPGGLGRQPDGEAPWVTPLQPASGPPGSDPLVTVARQVMGVVPSTEPHPPPHDSTSGPQPPESQLGQGLKQEQLGWGGADADFPRTSPPKAVCPRAAGWRCSWGH